MGSSFWRVCAALLNVWLLSRLPPVGALCHSLLDFIGVFLLLFGFFDLWLSFEKMNH